MIPTGTKSKIILKSQTSSLNGNHSMDTISKSEEKLLKKIAATSTTNNKDKPLKFLYSSLIPDFCDHCFNSSVALCPIIFLGWELKLAARGDAAREVGKKAWSHHSFSSQTQTRNEPDRTGLQTTSDYSESNFRHPCHWKWKRTTDCVLVRCSMWTFQETEYHMFQQHPCLRFIPELDIHYKVTSRITISSPEN